MKRWLLLASLAAISIQLVPIQWNQGEEQPATDFVMLTKPPLVVRETLHRACYDCHSNHTRYPWYAYIQPVGLVLQHHVDNGKKQLNFSEFGTLSRRRKHSKLRSVVEQLESDQMPLPSYRLLHPEARLDIKTRQMLLEYIDSIDKSNESH